MLIISIFFYLIGLYFYYLDMRIILEWVLFNYNSLNIEIIILLDWIMCLFVRVVLLISSMIILYSIVYIRGDKYINRFINILGLFIFSIILIIISPNLIRILFGWDGLGLRSYCLVIYYQNYVSFNSGIVTVLCNRLGDVGLLISIRLVFVYGRWGIWFELNYRGELVIFMILIAGLTKRAQIPFSIWLPLAIAAPTPVSALVHSSTLVTAGVYLIFRFNRFLIICEISKLLLIYISVFTIFIAGLMANFEIDLKKIIALSTLSQLGLIIMTLSLGLKFLAFYHLLTHAIFKSLLFMCAGIMIHFINNNQDIRFYGKLNEFIPFTIIRFYISRLALIGFPFIAGFYSKDLIIESVYIINFNLFIFIFIIISILFTVSYSLRLIYYIFFRDFKWVRLYIIKENVLINISIIILLILSIFGGSIFFWICFFDNYFIYIHLTIKLLVLVFILIGIIFIYFLYMKNLIQVYLLVYYFRSIWMLSFMYLWVYKPFIEVGIKRAKIDIEWIEFFRKDLVLKIMENIKLNNNLYNIYVYMFIIWIFIIILFIFF